MSWSTHDSGLKTFLRTGPRLKVSSDRLVEPGVELGTPGLKPDLPADKVSLGRVLIRLGYKASDLFTSPRRLLPIDGVGK